MPCICVVPAVDGIGGMASFRFKFESGLRSRGIRITHNPDGNADAVLVIGGTKNLLPLWRARRRGLRVVQRLDGINWVHRRRNTGLHHFLRAEYGNFDLSLIRSHIATHILYQSEFSHRWWDERYGKGRSPFSVVHNGVNLNIFSPRGEEERPKQRYRLLVVEGSLGGGYDMGLKNAVQLAGTLIKEHGLPMELVVVGRVGEVLKTAIEARGRVPIVWAGVVPQDRIPGIDRSAHLFFSSDLNPACPNAVIEAMACGLPVVAFDTGALNELVVGDSGRLVPYGGNPWKLDPPDIPALADAAAKVLHSQSRFRTAAREQAEKSFSLEQMMDGYLGALVG